MVTAPPVTTVSASIALLFQTRAVTAGQLSEFRRALEVEAAQLAAARRLDADINEIAAAFDAYLSCGPDAAEQNVHGRAFHHAVARAGGNPLLAETMVSINDAFAECFSLLHAAPDPSPLIHALHWPILDAIRREDAAAAREAMLAHFDQLEQVLRELGLHEALIGDRHAAPPATGSTQDRAPHRELTPLRGRG